MIDMDDYQSDQDENDNARPLNNINSRHIDDRILAGKKIRTRRTQQRFNISSRPIDEQRKWIEICDQYVLNFLYSTEIQDGFELDAEAIRLWKVKFIEQTRESPEIDYPTPLQIRVVLAYRFKLIYLL